MVIVMKYVADEESLEDEIIDMEREALSFIVEKGLAEEFEMWRKERRV
jgi:hypothetical protein